MHTFMGGEYLNELRKVRFTKVCAIDSKRNGHSDPMDFDGED